MKKMKSELIKTSILSIIALGVIILSTTAWFANNRETTSNGMKVGSQVQANLIIAKSIADLKSMNLSDGSFSIDFSTEAEKMLIPVTHDWSVGTATGLVFNSNPRAVSSTSGLKRGAENLTFSPVPVSTAEETKHYYVDYVAYIASMDATMETSGLRVDGIALTREAAPTKYLKALSVDFYVGEVNSSNYKGTLNLANQDYKNVNAATTVTSLKLTEAGEIPIHTSDSPIVVTMRIYFDGGLQEIESGAYASKTYIKSSEVDLSKVGLKVSFSAPITE